MKQVVKIFIQSKIIFLILVALSYVFRNIPSASVYQGVKGLLNPFTAYDSQNYLWMAEFGYTIDDLYAFFPLYPGLMRGLTYLGLSYAWSGFVISVVASFGVAYLFYIMAPEPYKKVTTWLWCMSPIAIFTWSIYTESLFIFLSLLSYYFFTQKKYWLVGIFVGLSMLTRNTGYFLIPFFLFLLFQEKKLFKDYISILLPAGLIGGLYPIYLWIVEGNLFYFAAVQVLYHKVAGYPWETIWRDIQIISVNGDYTLIILINYVAMVLAIYLAIKYGKKQLGFAIFILLGIIYPLFAPTIAVTTTLKESVAASISLVRYVFNLFPIYFLLAQDWKGRWKKPLYFGLGLFIYIFLTYMFISKSFVA